MPGSTAGEGMPVSTPDSTGPSSPQTRPYGHPQASPHSSTGMCIGRKIGPAFAIAWNAIGSTTHSAMQSAQNARFFAENVFFIGKLLCSILCAHYTRPSRSAEAP